VQTVIYADLLVILNIVVTLIIIITASDILRIDSSKTRYIAGAVAGGLFSLIILAPSVNVLFAVLIRLVMSAVIVLLSFKLNSIRLYIKCFLVFNGVSILLAGILLTAGIIVNNDSVLSNNGFIYVDFSISGIILIICASFLLIKIISRKLFLRRKRDLIYLTEIQYNGKKIYVKALFDSGNSVVDIFTGKPVIIVSLNELKPLFEADFTDKIELFFLSGQYENCPEKMRLLPVNTLGNSCFLPAFTADRAIVSGNELLKITEKPCIAISDNTFDGKNYSALINEAVTGQVI